METGANNLFAAKGKGGAQKPNFDILRIVKEAGINLDNVRKIDVPAGIWTVHAKQKDAPDREHPILWEHGGFRTDGSDSMCSVIADSNGNFVPSSHVRRVMHGNPRPNGQQAMVEVCQGSMFSIGFRHSTNWTILVYRIGDVTQLDPDEVKKLFSLGVDTKPEDMARLSCDLIAWHIKTWKTKNEMIPPEAERLIELTKDKLTAESWGPINCECWRKVSEKDLRNEIFKSEVFETGTYKEVALEVKNPSEILIAVDRAVLDYRLLLLGMPKDNDEKITSATGNYAVRVQQDLWIEEGLVGMRMSVIKKAFSDDTRGPLTLDQLDQHDIAVFEVFFENELPFGILDSEPSLFHGCRNLEELIAFIVKKQGEAKGFNSGDVTSHYLTNR